MYIHQRFEWAAREGEQPRRLSTFSVLVPGPDTVSVRWAASFEEGPDGPTGAVQAFLSGGHTGSVCSPEEVVKVDKIGWQLVGGPS